jgi:protein-S-isoprenylcysteine O-methyltransferase Ste14
VANRVVEACWIGFCLVWLTASFSAKKTAYRQRLAEKMQWELPLVLAALLLWKAAREPYPLSALLIPHDAASGLLGSLICVGGLAFSVWARVTLGRNWSSAVTLKVDHELVRRGPYGLVRHAIYTGLLAMVLGTVIVDGHVAGLLAVALFFVGVWVKARQEETLS